LPRRRALPVARIYDRANVGKAPDVQPGETSTRAMNPRAHLPGNGMEQAAGEPGLAVRGCAVRLRVPAKPAAEPPPTLHSLASRKVDVVPDQKVAGSQERTNRGVRGIPEVVAESILSDPRRSPPRRSGDGSADVRAAGPQSNTGAPDYHAAVKLYQEYLKNFPRMGQ